MTPEQSAAYVMAAVARLNARVAGMQAENQQRMHLGQSLAFTETAFDHAIFEEDLREGQVRRVLVDGEAPDA